MADEVPVFRLELRCWFCHAAWFGNGDTLTSALKNLRYVMTTALSGCPKCYSLTRRTHPADPRARE